MKAAREVETKLTVSDGFLMPSLTEITGVERVAVRARRPRATYYDTEDLRLARSSTTVRHGTGEGRPPWTLTLCTAAPVGLVREDLTFEGPGAAVPAALLDLLTARLRGTPLQKVVQLRTHRTSSLLYDVDGRELGEVVDDQVDVMQGSTVVSSWRELELEQRHGEEKFAGRVLDRLGEAGARVGDQTQQAVRALGPRATAPPELPPPRPVHRKDPIADLVRWSLADGVARLVEHDLGVRRGLDDAVHQVRVTCRRLRSDLRTFRPLFDDPRVERLRQELAWLADSFGAARDLEVLRVRLRRTAAEDRLLPLDASAVDALLAGQEATAVARALEALRSTRYLDLLQLLHDVAMAPRLTARAEMRCDEALPELVARAWTQLAKRAGRLRLDDQDAPWHRARLFAKRARYTAETAQVALGRDVRSVVKQARRVQEHLGEHQDAAVVAGRMIDLADAHPDDHRLALACGRLAERERAHVLASRRAFLRTWEHP